MNRIEPKFSKVKGGDSCNGRAIFSPEGEKIGLLRRRDRVRAHDPRSHEVKGTRAMQHKVKTAAGKMKVKLGPRTFKVVASYKEASEAVQHDIRTGHGIYGIGSQKWYALGAGGIFVDGIEVAHVSYNGRVWKGKGPGKVGDEEIPL